MRKHDVGRHILLLSIAAVPALISIAFVFFFFNAWLGTYWPIVSDDVTFNMQIRAMAHAGLGGGYFNVNESLPILSGLKGGVHGPVYPALYGLLLAPFGDVVAGPIYVNHVLLTA